MQFQSTGVNTLAARMSEDGKLSIEEVAKYFRLSAEEEKKIANDGNERYVFCKKGTEG